MELALPKDFLWGATLGAYAVEGGDFTSDWWHWSQRPGRIRDGATAQEAAGHFTRWRDDIALASKLGLRALCLSISWSRVCPEGPDPAPGALAHYAAVFAELKRAGIAAVAVLHEVNQPRWFLDKGGWLAPKSPARFESYARGAAEAFARDCAWWIPIWEPGFAAMMRHGLGLWPPGAGGPLARRRAFAHQAAAHRAAREALRDVNPEVRVGLSLRADALAPLDPESPWDARAARRETHALGAAAIEAAGGAAALDFLMLSRDGAQQIRFWPGAWRRAFAQSVDAAGKPAAADAFAPDPAGFREALLHFGALGLPILAACAPPLANTDAARESFLLDHLHALDRAAREGAPAAGFFWRTFLDGFAWQRGFLARQGLVHVDFDSGARTPNGIAYLYKGVIESGRLQPGIVERHCPGWRPPPPGAYNRAPEEAASE